MNYFYWTNSLEESEVLLQTLIKEEKSGRFLAGCKCSEVKNVFLYCDLLGGELISGKIFFWTDNVNNIVKMKEGNTGKVKVMTANTRFHWYTKVQALEIFQSWKETTNVPINLQPIKKQVKKTSRTKKKE